MAHRVKVKNMVMEMHEKNLVLTNLVRDIVENERLGSQFPTSASNWEICRILEDKAKRREELVNEIEYFLYRENVMAAAEG